MTLSDLPPEILSHIAFYAPTASFLRNLSLTSRKLNAFVEGEGWRIFVHTRFPSFVVPPPYKDAAHSLTTLSKNWHRRALIAKPVQPTTYIHELPSGRVSTQWNRPRGQTMGYQPVIDSYESWTGGDWSSRREVLVWGAGAELVMKWTERGGEVREAFQDASPPQRKQEFEDGPARFKWFTYREAWHQEGKDDVVSANVLRPHQRFAPNDQGTSEEILIGRASGELTLVNLSRGATKCSLKTFDTTERQLRTVDLSSGSRPLVAACLGDESLSVFAAHDEESHVSPLLQVQCTSPEEHGLHTWSTRFLNEGSIAVGCGISDTPVHVYDVNQSGGGPSRKFKAGRVGGEDMLTSVYPIVTVPESHDKDDASGNVFLAGGYDGNIRLYDMRSPAECEAMLNDPTDIMPIFSLLMIGREHVVAGGNKHSLLKMFDLRMAGGQAYSYVDTSSTSLKHSKDQVNGHMDAGDNKEGLLSSQGWNIFVSSRDSKFRRYDYSPVYSLSSPSHSSSSLYVGLENSVVHLNFTSMLDKHPDPLYKGTLSRIPNGDIHVKRTWSAGPLRPLNLSMYEQTSGKMDLLTQRSVGPLQDDQRILPGYDERWIHVKYEDTLRRPPRPFR